MLGRFRNRIPKTVSGWLTLVLFAVAASLFFILAVIAILLNRQPANTPAFGITFSTVYADQLGIDAKEAYRSLLSELGVKRVRLPVYWDEIEPKKDVYEWESLDWLVETSEAHGVSLTMVIGQKVPRWPECFVPDWVERMNPDYAHVELLKFMEQVVLRYKDSPALERWQVENEAFFPFGICAVRPNLERFLEEIELVRRLDDHPIQVTVSGELDPYVDAAILADVLGISMYRTTWNRYIGYFYYPLTPGFYRIKASSVRPLVDKIVISELQAEPWFPEPVDSRPAHEWYQAFDADDMRRNIDFARRTGLDEVYLWGAEWWYYLKVHGEDRLWEVAKDIFSSVL